MRSLCFVISKNYQLENVTILLRDKTILMAKPQNLTQLEPFLFESLYNALHASPNPPMMSIDLLAYLEGLVLLAL